MKTKLLPIQPLELPLIRAWRPALPAALLLGLLAAGLPRAHAAPGATSVVESLTFTGAADPEQANFVLTGRLKGKTPEEWEPKLIYSLSAQVKMHVEPKVLTQGCELKVRLYQGRLKELALAMQGEGEVTQVTGPELRDWGVRSSLAGRKFLVIRPPDYGTNVSPTNFIFTISTKQTYEKLPLMGKPLCFAPETAALYDGTLEVKAHETLEVIFTNLSGLMLIRPDPPAKDPAAEPAAAKDRPYQFRFAGGDYALALEAREKDPDARKVAWENFTLTGELKEQFASFILTGDVVVKHAEGGTVAILAGDAALTSYPETVGLKFEQGQYWLRFNKPGRFPLELKFNAKVTPRDGWNGLNFDVPASSLRPLALKGLSADTQFQFPGAAKPERQGEEFVTFLPSAGKVQMQWKEAKTEEKGKLFYAVQGAAQIAVGPGLLRQAFQMEYKVMQGELNQLVFELSGEGEVTRVRGDDILAFRIEGPTADKKRRLIVQLNQGRKDQYLVVIQTQTPLGVFPLQIQPLRLVPEQAIRYGGHLLVVNDGAVRLEVTDPRGLSQISPDLFPKSKELAELTAAQRNQAFAYRFAGADYALAVQADHILPELLVSQLVVYQLGETETSIDAEFELDIRDAPLREFYVRVPSDFNVSPPNIAQLSDYFITPEPEAGWSKLRIIFTAPQTGRLMLKLRLEKNQAASAGPWPLPVIQPQNVKSLRGHVGVSADTGFRLTPGALVGLTDIASALFPRQVARLQLAYRLREETWSATINVERLTLSIQADAVHLFTIKEGLAYGSSVLNYLIAGTPVSVLKLSAPAEYNNLEFAGRDVRNWKKTDAGYEVYLHTPVFGAYTLLATYDRQFNAKSNTVLFTGLHPLEVQSDQGSVLLVSDFQFDVKPVEVSPGLLSLDPLEILPEHRLLYDSPILAAYQYTSRPFVLRVALNSLAPGETVHQVVDRAALRTHVSREGEVVTEARYYIKSQGHTHLRVTLPPEAELWDAKVNGKKVMPVADRNSNLLPLPAKSDATSILKVDLKVATKSPDKKRLNITTPALAVPVLQTEWQVNPDERYRLKFLRGTATALTGQVDASGFALLEQMLRGSFGDDWKIPWLIVPLLLLAGTGCLRWATGEGVFRWSARHWVGTLFGAGACLGAVGIMIALIWFAVRQAVALVPGLSLLAPIQEAGKALSIQVNNLELGTFGFSLATAWPAVLGVILWLFLLFRVEPGVGRRAGWLAGWVLLSWGALKSPNGLPVFLGLLLGFLLIEVIVPALRCQLRVPRRERTTPAPPTASAPPAPAAGAAPLLLCGGLGMLLTQGAAPALAAAEAASEGLPKSIVQSVVQQGRVQEGFVYLKAQLVWKTEGGQRLDFLATPAVLTQIDYPQDNLQLSETKVEGQPVYRLAAKTTGQFQITFQYQVAHQKESTANGFILPTAAGLVNRLDLEVDRAEVEVYSTNAVSVQTSRAKRQDTEVTRGELVLAPAARSYIAWKPRARDTRMEKAVFYAELYHLFIPTPGVVEGVHEVQVRPAQGQLAEVTFQIPAGLTVTDVQADYVSSWRFDPDQLALRVQFTTPQAKPFALRLRSQLASGTLPYDQTNGVITLAQAASQVGMAGVATGPEVQLDGVKIDGLSLINLEDFPTALVSGAAAQVPGLTLRRAYRYAAATAKIIVSASAVQPDVRVETDELLSLGEDRILLTSQLAVHILRAGIFKLSFALPPDFEVLSISGTAMSHWTELKTGGERNITLHLRGKTEGDQSFSITLASSGLGNRKEWDAPRLVLREANKQTGQLVIVPELGLRLHAKTREGLTLLDPKKVLDPKKMGMQPKGLLAFRLLQPRWQLGFEVETVEPWIQAASLQDVTVREGQALIAGLLEYQIENAGVKSFQVQVPAAAENVRFEGDLLSDFVRQPDGDINRWINWEVKLQRRITGNYRLRLTYQLPVTTQAVALRLAGIKARNANLQRGYLAVRAGGRLQLQFPGLPPTLQRTEWQSLPVSLRRGRELAESKDTFTIMESDFELPLAVSRHEIAKVLPARVEKLELTSVMAPTGEMLTEGRLLLQPGDKRLLRLKLPTGSQFWYAFVNGQNAWPWREGGEILLLLEKNSDPDKATAVEFFYTSQTKDRPAGGFTHQLHGPAFDLPLENISWRVFVPEDWRLKDWASSLQLRPEVAPVIAACGDLELYLQSESARRQEKTKEAEGLYLMGHDFLQKGTPQQARRAYQAAWKLSPSDAAFNEDARTKWHNVKMQQALLGLNQRRQAAFEYLEKRDGKTAKSPFTRWEPGQAPDFTQQLWQQALEKNSEEDYAALYRLAERLIRQQDAGVSQPEAIRAALPTQGKQLTFTGSLQVQKMTPLEVKLDIGAQAPAHWQARLVVLAALFALLVLLALLRRSIS